MRKKLLVFGLIMAMALFAFGCSKGNDKASDTGKGSEVSSTYPDRPVTMIVARGAAGSTTTAARTLQPYLEKYLGQKVIIENKPGAGGKIGGKYVADAKNDGYTLLFTVTPTDILSEVVEGSPYSTKNLTPIGNVGGGDSNVLIARANAPFKNLEEFVAYAKTHEVTVAKVTGVSIPSIGLALLMDKAGIPAKNFITVPFDGSGEAMAAVAGGNVDIGINLPPQIPDMVKAGKIKAITVFSENELSVLPGVTPFAKLYPGSYYYSLQSVFAPGNLDSAAQKKLDEALQQAVNDPEFKASAEKQGFTAQTMSSADLGKEVSKLYDMSTQLKPLIEGLEKAKDAKKK